jgi:protein-ribulosamine 3-kinase
MVDRFKELLPHLRRIQESVGGHLGRPWRISEVHDLGDSASHPAAVLSDGVYRVFAKLGAADDASAQFRCEAIGLASLAELAGVRTPRVIEVLDVANGVVLVMEAVDVVDRDAAAWREAGRALARIHGVKGTHFGFDTDSYWGDFRQDNRPLEDWHAYFWQRWIEPRVRDLVDAERLPDDLVRRLEKVGARAEALCGPRVEPSLLHGDAHQNNILSTPAGPVFIDPNVHYGHPELDLAFVDYFQPVPAELFEGYEEMLPIAADFAERREFWRLPFSLAMLEVEGDAHLDALGAVLDRLS